jgi:endosialidase-like protein
MEKFIASLKQMASRARTNESSGLQHFNLRTAAIICALLALIVVGRGFAQAQQPDPLTITKDGKVGIGTTTPANKLSVDGNADFNGNATVSGSVGIGTNNLGASRLRIANSSADFAHFRFAEAGGGELEFVSWVDGWNINARTAGKNLYLNRDAVSDVLIGHFGREMMIKGDSGNVGIGTASPQSTLTVGKSTGGGNYAQDAVSGWRDGYLLFRAGTQRAAVGMDGSGTKLQLFTGAPSSDSTARLTVDSSGNVGIGTATPRALLEVSGTRSVGLNDSPDGFCNNGGFNRCLSLGSDNGGNFNVSILASGWIAGAGIVANSDRRVKEIAGPSDTAKDLEIIQKLRVTNYRPKDKIAEGNSLRTGFIGQEVLDVLPQAVATRRNLIPDIYSKPTKYTFDQNRKTLSITLPTAHALTKGQVVQILTEEAAQLVTVLEVPTPDSFVAGGFEKQPQRVFVYGRQVDDFLAVNYDQIFTTAVGALQEVKKQKDAEVKALQDENTALRRQLVEQENRLADLEAKDKARDEKLAAIESILLSGQQRSNRSASAKKVN